MLRQLLGLGILLAILVGFSQGECNACSAESNAACVSTNQYQNCTDNIPTGPIYTCPNNTNCTGSAERCTSNATLFSCNDCNKCVGKLNFTCTGPSTFSRCDGLSVVSVEYSCSSGQVCNINNKNYCAPPINGTGATCSYYNSTTVIVDFCNTKASTGRFPYPNDSSCLRYIYCFSKGSTWIGNTWKCPSNKPYFSNITLNCVTNKPLTCV
ncbi:uncharacterized protein LOC108150143 [Drosophila elegans]|uniref:uncharacterized protein LOC108150143 n=1 Tax=Drosophila elegans TaxID=30023 RepID=UPI0007E899DE|nr:uncharacterized protein LOC108150143 [Drosophila elegans]